MVQVSDLRAVASQKIGGSMAKIQDGKIKTISEKGFGFIQGLDGVEYFFHKSACENCRFEQLTKGDFVHFQREESPKGPRAEHINI